MAAASGAARGPNVTLLALLALLLALEGAELAGVAEQLGPPLEIHGC